MRERFEHGIIIPRLGCLCSAGPGLYIDCSDSIVTPVPAPAHYTGLSLGPRIPGAGSTEFDRPSGAHRSCLVVRQRHRGSQGDMVAGQTSAGIVEDSVLVDLHPDMVRAICFVQ